MKKILVITPYANLGGSEVSLFSLLKYINKEEFQIKIYSPQKGPLSDLMLLDYEYRFDKNYATFPNSLKKRAYNKLFNIDITFKELINLNKRFKPDMWYINTCVIPQIAQLAVKLKIPYFIHVHELFSVLQGIDYDSYAEMMSNAKKIICCSVAVQDYIKRMRPDDTFLLYENVDFERANVDNLKREEIKNKLGINKETFVWLISGMQTFRKGFTAFPEIVNRFKNDNVIFIWKGAYCYRAIRYYVEESIKNLNLQNKVMIIDQSYNQYYEYFDMADGVLLPSTEDPFPLVMIEASYFRKPVVAYASGGSVEFIKENTGIISENNIDSFEKSMRDIMNGTFYFNADEAYNQALQYDSKRIAKLFEEIIK